MTSLYPPMPHPTPHKRQIHMPPPPSCAICLGCVRLLSTTQGRKYAPFGNNYKGPPPIARLILVCGDPVLDEGCHRLVCSIHQSWLTHSRAVELASRYPKTLEQPRCTVQGMCKNIYLLVEPNWIWTTYAMTIDKATLEHISIQCKFSTRELVACIGLWMR